MKLHILGAVAAEGLNLGPRRQRALLARLVLAEGQAVPADVLIDDLWQGNPPAKALLSLQAHVARLRRVLDQDHRPHRRSSVLPSSWLGFELCLPQEAVDAWWFAALVDAGRFDDALDLWRTPVCGEFAAAPWAREGIERLERLHRIALERRRFALLDPVRLASAQINGSGPRFVGREREQAELRRLASTAAASGRGAVVLMGGEPMVGRTALVEWLAQWLAAQGWAVAWANGAHHPWQGLLGQLTEQYAQAREEWTPRLAVRALRTLSGARPLLLVLDDLHEADEESVSVLVEAARETASARVLIVATYRSTGFVSNRSPARGRVLDAALARLASREPYRMVVGGLADDAIGRLLAVLAARPIGNGTIAAVARRTGGHPFYVRELARMIRTEGEQAARFGVPTGVRDVLRHRVAGLSKQARWLLDRGVVLGVERAIDQPGEEVVIAAEELMAAGLIVEQPGGRIDFALPLIGDALAMTCGRRVADQEWSLSR